MTTDPIREAMKLLERNPERTAAIRQAQEAERAKSEEREQEHQRERAERQAKVDKELPKLAAELLARYQAEEAAGMQRAAEVLARQQLEWRYRPEGDDSPQYLSPLTQPPPPSLGRGLVERVTGAMREQVQDELRASGPWAEAWAEAVELRRRLSNQQQAGVLGRNRIRDVSPAEVTARMEAAKRAGSK